MVSKYKAFTLAEILITLGIIGVVAAMTIPILMQNIQDMQFKEAAKAAYSKASQAVNQMKNDNGGDLSYYYGNTNKFKPDFIQYFKVAKDCGNSGCFPSNLTTLHGDSVSNWITGYGQFVTIDGMTWGIYNASGSNPILITVDVNGHNAKPNILGRDIFLFQLLNDNVVPMGSQGTWFANQSNGNYYCKKSYSDPSQGYGCMDFVIRGTSY